MEPHKIILSFGLNNRQQRFRINALAELQKARNAAAAAAAARLPNTEVLIPVINYSPTLPLAEQTMVDHIKRGGGSTPALSAEQFRVESDGIHWKPLIFEHRRVHLN